MSAKKPTNLIDYPQLLDSAMRGIVQNTLKIVEKHGIINDGSFLISFITRFPGVQLSKRIRDKYPEEMTIVLQHQFENLQVNNEYFSVEISFDGIKEVVKVPYYSLTSFVDPSAKFALKFEIDLTKGETIEMDLDDGKVSTLAQRKSRNKLQTKVVKSKEHISADSNLNGDNKIVMLDDFRKK